jgi:glycylpeptide N-tetradecanoyltransferase
MSHEFWGKQPVSQLNDVQDNKNKKGAFKTLSHTKMNLPSEYEWWNPDIDDDEDLKAISKFLKNNYIEDKDNEFCMDYGMDMVKWFLTPPNYDKKFNMGLKKKDDKKIAGFIGGIPIKFRIGDKIINLTEVNFLCIHKKHRNKNLAPLLINEITNQSVRHNIHQAIYTVSKLITKPISTSKCWHRIINFRKMVEIKFMDISDITDKIDFDTAIERLNIMSYIDENIILKNLRPMKKEDVSSVCKLLNNYLKKKNLELVQIFNESDIEHWLLPRDGIVYTYVLENDNKVTDFISFYKITSQINNSDKYDSYNSAYCFYYSINTVDPDVMIKNVLYIAKKLNFDVFNVYDIMDNDKFINDKTLYFTPGTGELNYYLYNYKYNCIDANKIGMVMV